MDIKQRDRNQLKTYFVKRAVPSEQDFAELIDGMLNQKDDRVVKQPGSPLSLEAIDDAASRKQVLHLYETFDDSNPAWALSMNPRTVVSDPSTARSGFSIDGRTGISRLFIDDASGNIGIGTVEPEARLHIAGDARVNGTFRLGGELRVDGAVHVAPGSSVHVAPGSIAQESWIDLATEPAGKWQVNAEDFEGHTFNPAGFFKDTQGMVHLRGWIKNGTRAKRTVMFKLPEGYRPEYATVLTINHLGGHPPANIAILPDGDTICWLGIGGNVMLDGLTFRAAQ